MSMNMSTITITITSLSTHGMPQQKQTQASRCESLLQ
jgi:hypothetical protein